MLWGTGKYNALQEELSKVREPIKTDTEKETISNTINVSNLKNFFSNVYTMLSDTNKTDSDPLVEEETVTSEFSIWWRWTRWWWIWTGSVDTGTNNTTFTPHF